jgi:hypothetical protein
MRISILFLLCTCLAASCRPKASISITCTTQSPTKVQCTAKSAGPDAARPCWDVIVTCEGAEAEAEKVCAKKLGPGESETVVVEAASFKPAVKDFGTCSDLHYDELKIE